MGKGSLDASVASRVEKLGEGTRHIEMLGFVSLEDGLGLDEGLGGRSFQDTFPP